jgi:hypothetical protein
MLLKPKVDYNVEMSPPEISLERTTIPHQDGESAPLLCNLNIVDVTKF